MRRNSTKRVNHSLARVRSLTALLAEKAAKLGRLVCDTSHQLPLPKTLTRLLVCQDLKAAERAAVFDELGVRMC